MDIYNAHLEGAREREKRKRERVKKDADTTTARSRSIDKQFTFVFPIWLHFHFSHLRVKNFLFFSVLCQIFEVWSVLKWNCMKDRKHLCERFCKYLYTSDILFNVCTKFWTFYVKLQFKHCHVIIMVGI